MAAPGGGKSHRGWSPQAIQLNPLTTPPTDPAYEKLAYEVFHSTEGFAWGTTADGPILAVLETRAGEFMNEEGHRLDPRECFRMFDTDGRAVMFLCATSLN